MPGDSCSQPRVTAGRLGRETRARALLEGKVIESADCGMRCLLLGSSAC